MNKATNRQVAAPCFRGFFSFFLFSFPPLDTRRSNNEGKGGRAQTFKQSRPLLSSPPCTCPAGLSRLTVTSFSFLHEPTPRFTSQGGVDPASLASSSSCLLLHPKKAHATGRSSPTIQGKATTHHAGRCTLSNDSARRFMVHTNQRLAATRLFQNKRGKEAVKGLAHHICDAHARQPEPPRPPFRRRRPRSARPTSGDTHTRPPRPVPARSPAQKPISQSTDRPVRPISLI